MLLTVLSSLILVEDTRRLDQAFLEPVRKVWNTSELRVLVLLSLALQVSLLHFGHRRKYNAGTWIRRLLWFAYLTADWVATFALGVLSYKERNSCSCDGGNPKSVVNELTSFWAPFLLLHLGGPDTITAYEFADNMLWLRHLLALVVQTGMALYVTVLAWNGTRLSFITLPMLLAGIIKYGERTLALRSANQEQFRDSILTSPDPGPNYAKFMEEFCLKQAEGYYVRADEVIEVNDVNEVPTLADDSDDDNRLNIRVAHSFFQTFKRLFVDLILSFHDRDESKSYFQKASSKTAFKVIEIELGFAYDVFFTKAPIICTIWGTCFRFLTVSFTILVFVIFILDERDNHLWIDLSVSCILLGGAILLESYAVILLLSSDWTNLWLNNHPNITSLFRALSCVRRSNKRRWSNSVAQCNLLRFSLEHKPAVFHRILKLFPVFNKLEKRWQIFHKLEKHWETLNELEKKLHKSHSEISANLKDLIFIHFKKKSRENIDPINLCSSRGDLVLEGSHFDLNWSTTEVEFDQSILIWHIATDLCYYSYDGEKCGAVYSSCEESKHISDYMLYLLVMCPFMLPTGIGMIRFRDTCAEAEEFFRERNITSGIAKACGMLLKVSTEVLPTKVKGDRSKSVLFDACRLASSLREIELEDRWKIVSNVWVELLGYAATHCRGSYHAQQLKEGGELLTHVWLLMAHLGITEQFQISQGHARAKLIVT